MSDGPYKSLPMKPSWRRAARCAYNQSYSIDEIVEGVTRASHADWRAEMRPSLIASLNEVLAPSGQQALFADQTLSDLDSLHRTCSSPMESSFVSNAIDAVRTGKIGVEAVQIAAEDAVSDRLLRTYRLVEEHVRRDDNSRNANVVRTRLEAAHQNIDLSGLAQTLLKTGTPLSPRRRAASTDLDAGVSL